MRPKAGPVLVSAAVLLGAVAGCLGGKSDQGSSTAPPTTTVVLEAKAERPDWVLGQSWTYAVEVPGEPTRNFRMMVAQDRDDLWVVASSDRALAVHQALYSTNPVLGRINKTTLSPFQSGAPVEMYRFPLSDGKAWTNTFFGESMDFLAEFVGDIDTSRLRPELGLGPYAEGFRIEAKGASGRRVLYDFVEAVEWFSSFEVLEAGGNREIKLTLVDLEAAYRGPYYFWRAQDALVQSASHAETDGVTPGTHDATVPEGSADRVALGIVYVGAAGTVPATLNATLKDPAGTAVWSRDLSGATQIDVLQDFAGAAGKWTVEVRMTGNLEAEIRVVGMQNYAEGSL